VDYLLSKVLKTSRKLSKKLKLFHRSLLFIFFGLILLSFGGINYYRVRILSFKKAPAEAQSVQQGELPIQITIPSIKIDIPIDSGTINNGVWQISYKNATFLANSARPGAGGNTVIYGHNKKAIFGSLPYLSIGQKVIVKTQDGKLYTYEVYKKDFVRPDRVDLVSPTNYEELTLFTCWGLFDSQRVVVKAKPMYNDY